jgi:hypothetical protein
MTPTVSREEPFRFFFFSREKTRMHVHVAHPDGEAKFWLDPEVELATQTGSAKHVIGEAQQLVEDHLQEIIDAENKHFPGRSHERVPAWPVGIGW